MNTNPFLEDFYCGDGIKANYREYLEEWGICSKIQEILSDLMQKTPRPENPLNFIIEKLDGKIISETSLEEMDAELEDAEREIHKLRKVLSKMGENPDEDSAPDATVADQSILIQHV